MEVCTYDEHHRLVTVIDYRGERTSYTRDAFGRVTAVTDPLSQVTRFECEDQRGFDFWSPTGCPT